MAALINTPADAGSAFFPYESLNAYYQRASYGRLNISGDAFSYTAQYERSHYDSNVEELFHEALIALDNAVDFSQYDANGDGMIDAVYLHFAGPDSGWNSTWWSESRQAEETFQYDGKRLFNMVTLHQPSTAIDAARTIIHETGHVLGAPDLYSYSRYTYSASPLRSTCTWDLMDNNTGDINGFFKWMKSEPRRLHINLHAAMDTRAFASDV